MELIRAGLQDSNCDSSHHPLVFAPCPHYPSYSEFVFPADEEVAYLCIIFIGVSVVGHFLY